MNNVEENDQKILEEGLDILREEGAIRPEDRNLLADLSELTIDRKTQVSEAADELAEDLIAGRISYETFLEKLRALGSYETEVNFDAPASAVTPLIENGIITPGTTGLRFSEPFWPFMYKLLDSPTNKKTKGHPLLSITGRSLVLIGRAVRWICERIGIHHALENRYWLAHSISATVGQEQSLLFSRTPAVFNPREFNVGAKNYTFRFSKMLQNASQRTVYVWNLDAIAELIRKQLGETQGSDLKSKIDKLKSEYIKHFSKYSSQPFLEYYWGDNSSMTKPKASMQYISEKRIVVGARDIGGRMDCGININRARLREIVLSFTAGAAEMIQSGSSLLVVIAGSAIADKVLGPRDFNECYRQLVLNAGYENLTGLSAQDVVERAFVYSLREEP